MRIAIVLLVLVAWLSDPVCAHEGRISLFTDSLGTDCNMDIPAFQERTIYLVYIRGDGPEQLVGFECSLHLSTGDAFFALPSWPPGAVTMGSIEDGISVSFPSPLPPGETVWLGTIPVFSIVETDHFIVSVCGHPAASPPGINIVRYPSLDVSQALGGTFVFNGECEFDNAWYVRPDGTGEVLNIQAGIDVCDDGDTVLAGTGTYYGDGNRDINFNGKAIVVRSEYGSDSTIIDCGGPGGNHRGFIFDSGEDTLSVIDGFTITHGYIMQGGGGIFCKGASPKIINNIIRNNRSLGIILSSTEGSGKGGGIYTDTFCVIRNNIIRDNVSEFVGGGVYSVGATIENSSILSNRATWNYGGGIYCVGGTITNCSIVSNSVDFGGGGGIWCSSTTLIRNCRIAGNLCGEYDFSGGGIRCTGTPLIENNIIEGNSAAGGGGIYAGNLSEDAVIRGNLVTGNHTRETGGAGVKITGSSHCEISYNTIFANNGNFSCLGGGLYIDNSSARISHNTICGNAAWLGGGIFLFDSNCRIHNNVVVNNFTSKALAVNTASGDFSRIAHLISVSNYEIDSGAIHVSDPGDSVYNCDVYDNTGGNYGGTIPDLTGLYGNISLDPRFCCAEDTVFTLRADSPCLPGNHLYLTDCGLIGAFGLGCTFDAPHISYISDILNDQGRQVTMRWYRCTGDSAGSAEPVLAYEVYRRIDDLPSVPSPCTAEDAPEAGAGPGRSNLLYPPGDWYYLFSVPAHGEDVYNVVAPTLEDSCVYNDTTATGEKLYYSTFFVRAATAVPTSYFDSEPDSGYSVDNLSPAAPGGLAGEKQYQPVEGMKLTWSSNTENDLSLYAVYRGTSADFVPGPGNLLSTTGDTTLFDGDYSGGERYFYKVAARDWNGNEGGCSLLDPKDVTGEETPVPAVTYLAQNYPNPFNPVTTISFGLASRSHVRISIFDVAGRLIRVLLDEGHPAGRHRVTWDGRSSSGDPVASGIYFCRLATDEFTATKKMILIR